MLILTRKANEQIIIDPGPNQIVITTCEVIGGRVKIGVDAPRSVTVLRSEVAARMGIHQPEAVGT